MAREVPKLAIQMRMQYLLLQYDIDCYYWLEDHLCSLKKEGEPRLQMDRMNNRLQLDD